MDISCLTHKQKFDSNTTIECVVFDTGIELSLKIREEWVSLYNKSNCSMFLSWLWMDSWLNIVMSDSKLALFRIVRNNETISLGILASWQEYKYGIRLKYLGINTCLSHGRDMCIEKNGILVRDTDKKLAYECLATFLLMKSEFFDYIVVKNFRKKDCELIFEHLQKRLILDDCEEAKCWSLKKENNGNPENDCIYDRLRNFDISPNKVYQMRRFSKMIDTNNKKISDVVVEIVDKSESLRTFEKIAQCHIKRWHKMGKTSIFNNDKWSEFHKRMIINSPMCGVRMQLLEVGAPGQHIGYLYNMTNDNDVYNIQAGFLYKSDNKWRPGYYTHIVAWMYLIDSGYRKYDLLAGEDAYKSSICDSSEILMTLKLGGTLKARLLNPLKKLKRTITI